MVMYTRDQILQQYKVIEGKIVSPGKYEGQPLYAPYFDRDDEKGGVVTIRETDKIQFPELKPFKSVVITHAGDGRVIVTAFVTADYW